MMNHRISMLVSSCEKYSDLWEANEYFLKLNWFHLGLETYLVTDTQNDFSFYKTQLIIPEKQLEFTERLKYALSKINSDFILLTLDDYFLVRNVDLNQFENLMNIMVSDNIDYIRLFREPSSKLKYRGYRDLFSINLTKDYDVNLYPGIWRKSFLEKLIQESLDIWKFEVSLTHKALIEKGKCLLYKRDFYVILDVIRKGKILHKAKRFLRRNNLSLPNRLTISYFEEFKIYIMSLGKKILPTPLAIILKKIMRKFGYRFYSDYDKEIK